MYLMKRVRVCEYARRTVAPKMPFRKELDLLMVCMTGDGAGRTDSARKSAGEAQIVAPKNADLVINYNRSCE